MTKNAMSSGQARSIKITGDRLRKCFEKQCVNEYGEIKQEYLVGLNNQYAEGTYILKSGSNWQFHLGSFYSYTENWGTQFLNHGKTIRYVLPDEKIISDLRSNDFISKFLLKGNFFCVYDAPCWLIFDSQDIIAMLQDSEQVKWRILDSGRIKETFTLATPNALFSQLNTEPKSTRNSSFSELTEEGPVSGLRIFLKTICFLILFQLTTNFGNSVFEGN